MLDLKFCVVMPYIRTVSLFLYEYIMCIANAKDVIYVINYDFLGSLEDYVHRIGHRGRAKEEGTSYSFT